jgi:hypothetical protein
MRRHRRTRKRTAAAAQPRGRVAQVCAPSRRGRTARNTCFEDTTLVSLKNAYNARAAGGRVEASAPADIARDLRAKLAGKCKAESCWLDALDIPNRKTIKRKTFAPKHPDSWRANPREWLSNEDIDSVIEQYAAAYPDFKGIPASAMDYDFKFSDNTCVTEELCHFSLAKTLAAGVTKLGAVFNLDKHTESGSHWVALFVNIKRKYIFFLDSAGGKITPEIQRFVDNVQKQGAAMSPPIKFAVRSNYPRAHQKGNTECGMYATYFIALLASGDLSLKQVVRIFASKRRITDAEMVAKRKEMFNDVL